MGVALTLPRRLLEHAAESAELVEVQARYAAWLHAMAPQRPAVGSELEGRTLVSFAALSALAAKGLRKVDRDELRVDVDAQLRRLLEADARTTEIDRRLALAQLNEAVSVYASFADLIIPHLRRLPEQQWQALLAELEAADPAALVQYGRSSMLLGMALFVALECVEHDEQAEHLNFWASYAARAARVAQPELSTLAAGLSALEIRARAKSSWDGWTDDDIQEELSAWRELGR